MTILPKTKELQKGQAVLVILLVMSVLFTMGLSVVSRSITDVKISQQSQESARAFWVAQAGLEQALLAQAGVASSNIDGVEYTVTQEGFGGDENFVFTGIAPGESFTYWLVNHQENGDLGDTFYTEPGLTVFWGEGVSNLPALVVTLVYKDTAGFFQSTKFAFDALGSGRGTNFDTPDSGSSFEGVTFAYKKTLDFPATALNYGTPYFITFKMLYNASPQPIGVQGPAFTQGSCYESVATVLASGITRALRECRTWPNTPEIFNYLLFSGGDIIQ